MNKLTLKVEERHQGLRLDAFLSNELKEMSRNSIQHLIKQGDVLLDGISLKKSAKVEEGQLIEVRVPESKPLELEAEDIPLKILYEDEHLAVVNKPRGMVVHPSAGHSTGTLVHALMHHLDELSDFNGILRPGIVHRIDKDTTGLLLVTKDNKTHQYFQEKFKDHDLKRVYTVLVHGRVGFTEKTIDLPIGRDPIHRKKNTVIANGKRAVTHLKVLQYFDKYTLLSCQLETGRTHQIRVHLKYINHPVVGDPLYGPKNTPFKKGQLLHAGTLGFQTQDGKELLFTEELPEDFQRFLRGLSK